MFAIDNLRLEFDSIPEDCILCTTSVETSWAGWRFTIAEWRYESVCQQLWEVEGESW